MFQYKVIYNIVSNQVNLFRTDIAPPCNTVGSPIGGVKIWNKIQFAMIA